MFCTTSLCSLSQLSLVVALVAGVLSMTSFASAQDAPNAPAPNAPAPALRFVVKDIQGNNVDLAQKYAGKVVLILNVASKCGHTKQYTGLQKLHEQYAGQGLAVLGFPSNDFGGQEPGSEADILEFCQTKYDVTFDLFGKVKVKGTDAAPLFQYLTSATDKTTAGPIKWNFEKFLIGKDGTVVARFASGVQPGSDELVKAIEAELAR